jgi:ribose transport system permease protein
LSRRHLSLLLLNNAPLLLFAVILSLFGSLSSRFLTEANLMNVLLQSSSTAVVAVGMTFVLLTAGVDLSVGSIMFVAAAVAGKMVLSGASVLAALLTMALIGLSFGAINAFLITRLRMVAFIVTLATLYLGRGLALWITQTRAMNLPPGFLAIGTSRFLGIPVPIMVFLVVLGAAHGVLRYTPFGRQLYAVGQDSERARKAGVQVGWILPVVYLVSGLCAAIGAVLSLSQLGAVSPTFGRNKEFSAIAAAVLGGTSLFGGRGQVFPGTVLGAVLMQSVENGLVILNADPYLYPLFSSAIIFLAVLTDSLRNRVLANVHRRTIRQEEC